MGDSYYNNVSLLLHCDGSNGSTTFTDHSITPKTVTANGNAQISTAQSKFGGASGLFDGTGDYLSIPANADFDFGTADFTIEGFFRPTNINSTYQIFINKQGAGSSDIAIQIRIANTNKLEIVMRAQGDSATYVVSGTTTLVNNTWYHFALVCASHTFSMYLNGVSEGTPVTQTLLLTSAIALAIGASKLGATVANYYTGYLDDIRITKGIARYTSNFTPTTSAFPNGDDGESQVVTGSLRLIGSIIHSETPADEDVQLTPGQIIFVGSILHTVATTLQGGIAYEPRIECTQELDNLTDAMSEFDIDFAVTAPHYITLTNNPYASELPKSLGVGYTSNLPVETVTFSLPGSDIVHSYLYDFYYRVHTSVTHLALGNILSEQLITVEIWNAWFTNTTLDTIDLTNLPTMSLDLPETLPYEFSPLEYISGTIVVSTIGAPTIDGFFTLTFDTDIVYIYVTGQRVVIWPFAPQTTSTESKQWLTDILHARHGETRFVLREIPRQLLSYNYIFQTAKEFSLAKQMADELSQLALATPLWSDGVPLTNLTVGQTVLTFSTVDLELEVNSVIVLWENFEVFEVVEILSLTTTDVTLKQALVAEHRHCWVFPVRIGYLPNGINLARNENNKKTGSVTFNVISPFNLPIWPNAETFLGLPVISDTSVVTGGLEEKYSREVEVFDSETGNFVPFNVDDYNRSVQVIQSKAITRAQLYALRRQFDYLQGKYTAFWLPSFHADLRAMTDLNSGASSLRVAYAGWSVYGVHPIRIIGSSIGYFTVTAAVDNLDGTEDIAITPSASTTITDITRIEVLTKVRLDTDTVEISHTGRISTTKAPAKEILA